MQLGFGHQLLPASKRVSNMTGLDARAAVIVIKAVQAVAAGGRAVMVRARCCWKVLLL